MNRILQAFRQSFESLLRLRIFLLVLVPPFVAFPRAFCGLCDFLAGVGDGVSPVFFEVEVYFSGCKHDGTAEFFRLDGGDFFTADVYSPWPTLLAVFIDVAFCDADRFNASVAVRF